MQVFNSDRPAYDARFIGWHYWRFFLINHLGFGWPTGDGLVAHTTGAAICQLSIHHFGALVRYICDPDETGLAKVSPCKWQIQTKFVWVFLVLFLILPCLEIHFRFETEHRWTYSTPITCTERDGIPECSPETTWPPWAVDNARRRQVHACMFE